MTNALLLILTIVVTLGLVAIFNIILLKKWKLRHILAIEIAILYAIIFSTYLTPLLLASGIPWTGATFFFAFFMFLTFGGALLFGVIAWDRKAAVIWIAGMFLYLAWDNVTFGPLAVGAGSIYSPRDICLLDARTYAEDVFLGCIAQSIGYDPYSIEASLFVYGDMVLLIVISSIYVLGFKKTENFMFESGRSKR